MMRRRRILVVSSVVAATASCATPAADPIDTPAAVHFDVNSWGSRLHGWTFDASGRGRIEDAVPGTPRGESRTIARTVNVGMAGYRQIVAALAYADRLAQQAYQCRPEITDLTYGTVAFRRQGQETRLSWNTGCRQPRDQQLQETLVAADHLVDRLTGTTPHPPERPQR